MTKRQTFFRQSGYLIERGVLSPECCGDLTARAARLDVGLPDVQVDDRSRVTRVGSAWETLDLQDRLLQDRFVRAVDTLLGSTWVLVRNRHNHLTFDYGQGLRAGRLHRDSLHWTRSYVTALVALRISGCDGWPTFVPGSHLWPMEAERNGGGYWLDEEPSRLADGQELPAPLEAGDVLFLDPLTFHAAGRGTEASPRAMLTLALRIPDELTGDVGANEVSLRGLPFYAGQDSWRRRHVR